MIRNRKLLLRWSISLILILIGGVTLTWAVSPANQLCTIFTAKNDETVLFGSNEDWHSDELFLGFYPAEDDQYGSVHIGYRDGTGQLNFVSAINEHGLIWAVNSLPKSSLNPHPDRPYSHKTDNYFSTITHYARTVEDAIALSRQFDFGTSMKLQIHIADATGDAVIISPGPDGELAYTQISPLQDFLLSSNFNHAIPGNGKQGWRYDTAYAMLSQTNAYTSEYARDVLNAVKLDMLTTYTLISTVADLKKREITLFYLSQFNEGITLSVDDELSKGQRILPMEDFFSSKTVEAGKAAYRKFEIRFRAAQIGLVLFVGCILLLGFKFLRKRLHRHRQ